MYNNNIQEEDKMSTDALYSKSDLKQIVRR